MINIPKTTTVKTHYNQTDIEFNGDYYFVEVFVDNKHVALYGDYYHEKGLERSEGFVDALLWINPNIIVIYENVAGATE